MPHVADYWTKATHTDSIVATSNNQGAVILFYSLWISVSPWFILAHIVFL